MGPTEIKTGARLAEASTEVATAWKGALEGNSFVPTDKLYFVDWSALCAVLTPRRYELLRHLRAAPAVSVRALASELGRDVKRVHGDVVAMEELGLLVRNDVGGLSTDFDAITSIVRLAL